MTTCVSAPEFKDLRKSTTVYPRALDRVRAAYAAPFAWDSTRDWNGTAALIQVDADEYRDRLAELRWVMLVDPEVLRRMYRYAPLPPGKKLEPQERRRRRKRRQQEEEAEPRHGGLAIVEPFGCYTRNPSRYFTQLVEASSREDGTELEALLESVPTDLDGPTIILCPQRIWEFQERLQARFKGLLSPLVADIPDFLLHATFLHELGHHVFPVSNGGRYRTLSEGLANLFAALHMQDAERGVLLAKTFRQSSAYSAWRFIWDRLAPSGATWQARQALRAWFGGTVPPWSGDILTLEGSERDDLPADEAYEESSDDLAEELGFDVRWDFLSDVPYDDLQDPEIAWRWMHQRDASDQEAFWLQLVLNCPSFASYRGRHFRLSREQEGLALSDRLIDHPALETPECRLAALKAPLAPTERATAWVIDRLSDPEDEKPARLEAARRLARLPVLPLGAVSPLVDFLESTDPDIRRASLSALRCKAPDEPAGQQIARALLAVAHDADEPPEMRRGALQALQQHFSPERVTDEALRILAGGTAEASHLASAVLGAGVPQDLLPTLQRVPDPAVVLHWLGRPEVLDVAVGQARDFVCETLASAFERLQAGERAAEILAVLRNPDLLRAMIESKPDLICALMQRETADGVISKPMADVLAACLKVSGKIREQALSSLYQVINTGKDSSSKKRALGCLGDALPDCTILDVLVEKHVHPSLLVPWDIAWALRDWLKQGRISAKDLLDRGNLAAFARPDSLLEAILDCQRDLIPAAQKLVEDPSSPCMANYALKNHVSDLAWWRRWLFEYEPARRSYYFEGQIALTKLVDGGVWDEDLMNLCLKYRKFDHLEKMAVSDPRFLELLWQDLGADKLIPRYTALEALLNQPLSEEDAQRARKTYLTRLVGDLGLEWTAPTNTLNRVLKGASPRVLMEVLPSHPEPEIRRRMAAVLVSRDIALDDELLPLARDMALNEDGELQRTGLRLLLSQRDNPTAHQFLLDLAESGEAPLRSRREVLQRLVEQSPSEPRVCELLTTLLTSSTSAEQEAAVGIIVDADLVAGWAPALHRLLADSGRDPDLRTRIARALTRDEKPEQLKALVTDPLSGVRQAALHAFQQAGLDLL